MQDGLIALSDGRFKYIHLKKGKKSLYELFDMEKDPFEFHNAADDPAYSEKLAELRKAMLDILVETSLP
jgi:arylsulfatase A-like enzyme